MTSVFMSRHRKKGIARLAGAHWLLLWLAMALQPCLVPAAQAAMTPACARDMTMAQNAHCGPVAKLACELPARGPLATFHAEPLLATPVLAPASLQLPLPTAQPLALRAVQAPHAPPDVPLNLKHCVFLI